MNDVEPAGPARQEDATPPRHIAGFLLAIAGMALYTAGVQCAWRGQTPAQPVFGLHVWQLGAIVSAVGCMLFCVAIVLIWQISLKRLILLVILAGMMVGLVVQVGTKARDRRAAEWNAMQPAGMPATPVGGAP